MIRLGDGTEESKKRLLHAIDEIWSYTGEMFLAASYELQGVSEYFGVDLSEIQKHWDEKITSVFTEATLPLPGDTWMQSGGKEGRHTEYLGFILADMQFLQRAYPGADW